ncbi:MAG: hypothetical protein Q4B32_11125 [Clostridia bacterium]|nr:hypothetical protein [Clostridia bacterium]
MRKSLAFLFLCSILLFSTFSLADSQVAPEIITVLRNAGITQPVQLTQWGDTAACFAEADDAKCLIVLEKHDGEWQIVISNPTALVQDADWPALLLDSDNAIYWTYTLQHGEVMRFHSIRDAEGIWGPVDQYFCSAIHNGVMDTWNTYWDEAHGGEIIRDRSRVDENDNPLGGLQSQYFPATWMGDCIRLADFDLGRFPPLTRDPYYYWEGDRFVQDAAEALMPEYTYLKGLIKDGALHFLMQKPDGSKVYVIAEYASRRAVNFIESSPLPEDTYLGVENFTDSLWIHGRSVTIHLLYDFSRAGIEYIYTGASVSETHHGFLFFGDRTVWDDQNVPPQTILYGDHPWDDITEIDWNNLPYTLNEASAQMDSSRYAMVVNPKSTDRLHLREQDDKSSRSQGKYYTGTAVTVTQHGRNWTLVVFGDWNSWRQGYMMNRYLTYGQTGQSLRLDVSAMPQMESCQTISIRV